MMVHITPCFCSRIPLAAPSPLFPEQCLLMFIYSLQPLVAHLVTATHRWPRTSPHMFLDCCLYCSSRTLCLPALLLRIPICVVQRVVKVPPYVAQHSWIGSAWIAIGIMLRWRVAKSGPDPATIHVHTGFSIGEQQQRLVCLRKSGPWETLVLFRENDTIFNQKIYHPWSITFSSRCTYLSTFGWPSRNAPLHAHECVYPDPISPCEH